MRETGMVRRIDDLGRVVIPKEIRKTLRIREGDPLEIFTERDELVFRKYSPIASFSSVSEEVAESIADLTEKTCVITDTDRVLYVASGKKDAVGKTITEKMREIINDRKSVVISKSDGGELVNLTAGDECSCENQIIIPVVVNGDTYGAVVVADKDKTKRPATGDVKIAQLGAMFIAKQFC